jgi:hypothetical protein
VVKKYVRIRKESNQYYSTVQIMDIKIFKCMLEHNIQKSTYPILYSIKKSYRIVLITPKHEQGVFHYDKRNYRI